MLFYLTTPHHLAFIELNHCDIWCLFYAIQFWIFFITNVDSQVIIWASFFFLNQIDEIDFIAKLHLKKLHLKIYEQLLPILYR